VGRTLASDLVNKELSIWQTLKGFGKQRFLVAGLILLFFCLHSFVKNLGQSLMPIISNKLDSEGRCSNNLSARIGKCQMADVFVVGGVISDFYQLSMLIKSKLSQPF